MFVKRENYGYSNWNGFPFIQLSQLSIPNTHTQTHTHTQSVMGKERKISKVKGDGADDVAKESRQTVRAWDLLPDPGYEILAGCLPSAKTLASQVTAWTLVSTLINGSGRW